MTPGGTSPTPRHQPRRWLPWAAIVVVIAVALGIALPLTIGSSSSTVTPTPTTPTTNRAGGLTGSYFSTTIVDSSLLFLRLVEVQHTLAGALTVTTASASHTRLVDHRYNASGSVAGAKLTLTIAPGAPVPRTIKGTYTPSVITIALADGTTVMLHRGTLAEYRALVVDDRAILVA